MSFESIDSIYLICLFLMPGFVIKEIVDTFSKLKKASNQASLLQYLCFSIIHLGIWYWLYVLVLNAKIEHAYQMWLFFVLITLIGSSLIGVSIGLLTKVQILKKLFDKLHINIIHPVPGSWDYKFSTINGYRWIIVSLKNGSVIAGCYSGSSFASSDDTERDLYLEKVYLINKNYEWKEQKNTDGVLICKDEISTVEFFI